MESLNPNKNESDANVNPVKSKNQWKPKAIFAKKSAKTDTPLRLSSHSSSQTEDTQKEYLLLDTQAKEIYSGLLAISRKIISGIDASYIEIYEEALLQISKCVQTLKSNPFLIKYTQYSTADNYLYAHTANVTILSLAIGIELHIKELSILGIAALFHDTGMTNFTQLTRKERKLSEYEINAIRHHPFLSIQKLNKIIDFDYKDKKVIEEIILQVHERFDGSGYPKELKADEINILASIISVADSSEAMIHPRAWRGAMDYHLVIKRLIETKQTHFNPLILKKFIQTVTIFPPGSIVELSDGTMAQVLKINKGSLMRPVIQLILDADFNPIENKIVDLMKYPLTSIDNIVTFEKLSQKNARFAAELELSRIWIEW